MSGIPIEDELRALVRILRQEEETLASRRDALERAVKRARAEGLTLRRIAAITGLSFGRVHQIERRQ